MAFCILKVFGDDFKCNDRPFLMKPSSTFEVCCMLLMSNVCFQSSRTFTLGLG